MTDTNTAIDWRDVSGDDGYGNTLVGTRLLGTTVLAGVTMHVDAIAVDTTDGLQEAIDPALESELAAIYELDGGDGPFETTAIAGQQHEYVLLAVPFRS